MKGTLAALLTRADTFALFSCARLIIFVLALLLSMPLLMMTLILLVTLLTVVLIRELANSEAKAAQLRENPLDAIQPALGVIEGRREQSVARGEPEPAHLQVRMRSAGRMYMGLQAAIAPHHIIAPFNISGNT